MSAARFSTARSAGDHVGRVELVERLPSDPADERWRARLPLRKGPPVEVLAIAAPEPAPCTAVLARWRDADVAWTLSAALPPSSAPPVVERPEAPRDLLPPEAMRGIGEAWLALAAGAVDEAVRLARRWSERVGPTHARLLSGLVETLHAQFGDDPLEGAAIGLLRAGDLAHHGRSAEALAAARRALGHPAADLEVRGRLHYLVAMLSRRGGAAADGVDHARAAVELLDRAGSPRWGAQARVALATAAEGTGRFEEAEAAYREGLALARRAGSPEAEALVYGNYAGLLRATGRRDDARRALLAQLSLTRSVATRGSELGALSNLAAMLHDDGELRSARARSEEVVALARARGRSFSEGLARANLGRVLTALGELDRADHELRAALASAGANGNLPASAHARLGLFELHLRRGRVREALAEARLVEDLGTAASAVHAAQAR